MMREMSFALEAGPSDPFMFAKNRSTAALSHQPETNAPCQSLPSNGLLPNTRINLGVVPC